MEKVLPLKRSIQVVIRRGERQYVAECLDPPVVTQAESLDELARNISEAVALFLDGEDPVVPKTEVRFRPSSTKPRLLSTRNICARSSFIRNRFLSLLLASSDIFIL